MEYPQFMFWAKIRKISPFFLMKFSFFTTEKKSLYIAWASFCNSRRNCFLPYLTHTLTTGFCLSLYTTLIPYIINQNKTTRNLTSSFSSFNANNFNIHLARPTFCYIQFSVQRPIMMSLIFFEIASFVSIIS